jgi:hypothetical protein
MEAPTLAGACEYAQAYAQCTRGPMELARAGAKDAGMDARALALLSTSRSVSVFREAFSAPDGVAARFQGDDSAGRLLRWLRESEGGGVLVGTCGLWEGSDVPVSRWWSSTAPPSPIRTAPVIRKLCEKAGAGCFGEVTLTKAKVAVRTRQPWMG